MWVWSGGTVTSLYIVMENALLMTATIPDHTCVLFFDVTYIKFKNKIHQNTVCMPRNLFSVCKITVLFYLTPIHSVHPGISKSKSE